MHHSERLVLFPAHNDPSPVQYFGDKYGTEPRELQLRSTNSSQCYVMNPYQLPGLVFSPLNFAVVVMFLMQRRSLPLATPPGVRPRTRSPSFLPLPAPGASRTWPGPGVALPAQHHHVGGHPRASLWRSPVAHQDEGHELVPLLLHLPARRLQAPAQRPEASFYESVAPWVVRCSPCLVYPEQLTHLQHHF